MHEHDEKISYSFLSPLKRLSITHLFPYDIKTKKHSKLSDGLKEYLLLLISAKEAITYFLEGELSNFDALVGENSCQIRATMIWLVAHKFPIEGNILLKEIILAIQKIKQLKLNLSSDDETISLNSYIEKNKLDLKLDSRELFLIISYILTRVRTILPPDPIRHIVRNESTETKKVKEISPVGSSFARDIVKRLRSIASNMSVDFAQSISQSEVTTEMLSDKYCLTHDKFGRLRCLPCFWYTLALMDYSINNEIPIAITLNQIASDLEYKELDKCHLYYKVINGQYHEVAREELSDDTPALVILASCCRASKEFPEWNAWRTEISSYSPIELILAYAASHRQYPDASKDILIEQSSGQEIKKYKIKAEEWGCSLENPSLFFLVHAYCDKLKNIATHSESTTQAYA
jgi:hypothetical protein